MKKIKAFFFGTLLVSFLGITLGLVGVTTRSNEMVFAVCLEILILSSFVLAVIGTAYAIFSIAKRKVWNFVPNLLYKSAGYLGSKFTSSLKSIPSFVKKKKNIRAYNR